MYRVLRWGLNGRQSFSILTKRLQNAVSRFQSDFLIPAKQTKRPPDLMKTINEENEILIFKYDKTNYIRKLKYLSTSFFLVVTMTELSFSTMPTKAENPEKYFFEREEQKLQFRLLMITILMFGSGMYFFVCMYILRNVRSLIFKRDTREVIFETYSLLKKYRTLSVPVYNVSGVSSVLQKSKKGYIALKVKDNMFYYILDNNGKLLNRPVFDGIINLQRTFPKYSLWKTIGKLYNTKRK